MVTGQLDGLARDRAKLSADEEKLYGNLYDVFGKVAGGAWDNMLEPSTVAAEIVGALHTASPQARYQVGDDSKFLCDVARKTDPEIDATVAGFWGG